MRKPRVTIPETAAPLILDAYQSGLSTVRIAYHYNVTHITVTKFLRRKGVELRGRAGANQLRAIDLDEDRLIQMNNEARFSQREMAVELGVSLPTVERAFRRLGLRSKRGRGSTMEKNYFWKGGTRREEEGYVLVKCPDHPFASKDGYVREHRLVMERKIGRYLTPEEEVHHLDGNPQHNDEDNLMLFPDHASHLRYEWQHRWLPSLQRYKERHQQKVAA